MKRFILIYGIALAVLVFALKFIEYRFFVHDLSFEFYAGLIAILFTAIGVWSGWKLTSRKRVVIAPTVAEINLDEVKRLGISKREHEVLELMAKGMSNREIADQLFVSVNTVKTHISNLLVKLNAKRRTQAIKEAKLLGLIP